MSASFNDIQRWLLAAQQNNASYVIIVCDTYDYEDYPIEVGIDNDFWKIYDDCNNKNMQKIMEVYNLSLDINKQLNEPKAFNCPPKT